MALRKGPGPWWWRRRKREGLERQALAVPGGMERGRLTAMLLWMEQELPNSANADREKILSGAVPFAFFSVRYCRPALVAGSTGQKVLALYVEK